MNTLKRFLCFVTVLQLAVLTSGCVSLSKKHMVYSIKELHIADRMLKFRIKNISMRDIKSFTVRAEVSISGLEDCLVLEKTFDEKSDGFIEHGLENDYILEIEGFDTTDEALEDFEDICYGDEDEGGYINSFFISEIVFSDDTVWTDRYGTWAF